jgi:hypothetical protein
MPPFCCGNLAQLPWNSPEKGSIVRKMRTVAALVAQDVRHPPVDGLHSLDFPADTSAHFLLTLKLEGVKTDSFFDSF